MPVDVLDLCALLQCIGFKMKSMDNAERAGSHEQGAGKTVTINCNWSGLRVVLESNMAECNCPAARDEHSSGIWHVSGVSGGVVEMETGSSLLGSLPQSSKDKVTEGLRKLIQYTRACIDNQDAMKPRVKSGMTRSHRYYDLNPDQLPKSSASLTELNITPPEVSQERLAPVKVDTPTRYRSLDTLINVKIPPTDLPVPGDLVPKDKPVSDTSDVADDLPNIKRSVGSYKRQHTYTMSTPDKQESVMLKTKTSSPISKVSEDIMESIISAEKMAEGLMNKLLDVIKRFSTADDKPENSSVVSLALDVSKISVSKGPDPPSVSKFVSSPNLSSVGSRRYNLSESTLKRVGSRSSFQLNTPSETPELLKAQSKLKRVSPSFYGMKKYDSLMPQPSEGTFRQLSDRQQSKLLCVKARASVSGTTVPTPTTKSTAEDSGKSSSANKKKMYSHIKSTIPKRTFSLKKN